MSYIKLEFQRETGKAYLMMNGFWIPKSVLSKDGFPFPYFKVEQWYLNKMMGDVWENKQTEIQYYTLRGIAEMVVPFAKMPKDVQNAWFKRNSGGSISYDMEPRMWGNDCFEGSMSDHF